MYEVECTIDSKYSFNSQFYVNLEPSDPCKWKIFTSSNVKNGICCNSKDFDEKILGVWLVDEHGNDTPSDYVPKASPSLGVSWVNGEDVECDQSIDLILNETETSILPTSTSTPISISQSKRVKKYIPSSGVNLLCNKTLPSPFWLRAYDHNGIYATVVESFTAVASHPSKILLRCPSIFGEDSSPLQTLDPFTFTLSSKVTDLELTLVDENDHEASMSKVQDILVKISVILNSDILRNEEAMESEVILFTYSKKNPKNKLSNISIDFSTIIEKISPYRQLETDEILVLEATCSYSLNGARTHTTSATIISKFISLNTVNKLIPSFHILSSNPREKSHNIDSNSFSNSIYDSIPRMNENTCQCGHYSEINVSVQTNDLHAAEISEKDIDVQVSYENSKKKVTDSENIEPILNLQEIKSSASLSSSLTHTIVTYWIPMMIHPGKYSFKFIYTENRPKIISKKFLSKSVLQVNINTIIYNEL